MMRIRRASTAWSHASSPRWFLFVIMGATHGKAPAGFAPLAIGLTLVMIHLVSIPVTYTSVNPARSTGPALFVGGWALGISGCSGWRR
jgi:glycerol uptake facilitator-like aquaporin